MNIYICNTCQYLYFCRKFAEMDKRKRKPKRHLELLSSTDNLITNHVRTFLM